MQRMNSFGRRLAAELEQEFSRLANGWFLPWHGRARGEPIDLDDFRGGRIRLEGMRFDASAELAYWSAAARYAHGKIEETFGQAEEEIRAHAGAGAGAGLDAVAEDVAIQLRSFLERLHRHAVFTQYRLQARGYPDERYLDVRKDAAIAAKIQRRKIALIERFQAISLRRKVAMAAMSFVREPRRLTPILFLVTALAALVFCVSYTAAAATGGEFAARLSTASFANTPSNRAQQRHG
jgi:hypothetical protein